MEDAHFIFTSDPIELKSEGEDFFVEGYISTSDLDLVNDIVTKACLLDMAEQMKNRSIKLDVEHESFRGNSELETEINKTIIPAAKIEDFLMDKKGLKVRAKLNKHSRRFNEVKGSIEEGFLDAFSIAYIPEKSTPQIKDGQQVRMLDKIKLLNVAFTGNPVNTEAKMVNVFTKSLDFLEKKETELKKKYPWDQCIADQTKKGYSKERAAKICGAIRAGKVSHKDIQEYERVKSIIDHNHESELIKLKEVKMSEENEKVGEEPVVKPEEKKPEEPTKSSEEEDSAKKELAEVKSRLDKTEKELAEVKSLLNKPVLKSRVEQQDKSDNFVEKKAQNPLDLIA